MNTMSWFFHCSANIIQSALCAVVFSFLLLGWTLKGIFLNHKLFSITILYNTKYLYIGLVQKDIYTVKLRHLKLDGTVKKLGEIRVFEILRVKYQNLKNNWLGLTNHFDISVVFVISCNVQDIELQLYYITMIVQEYID